MILCSQCFDELPDEKQRFNGLYPQSVCDCCGLDCLGYAVRPLVDPNDEEVA